MSRPPFGKDLSALLNNTTIILYRTICKNQCLFSDSGKSFPLPGGLVLLHGGLEGKRTEFVGFSLLFPERPCTINRDWYLLDILTVYFSNAGETTAFSPACCISIRMEGFIMTLKECYDRMNGSYEEAKGRLMTDSMIERFVMKFLDDPTMDNLRDRKSVV